MGHLRNILQRSKMHILPAKRRQRDCRCISVKLDINYAKRKSGENAASLYDRQTSCNRANINKIVPINLSGGLFTFYRGTVPKHGMTVIPQEYSPNTLEGLINARWYRSFAMKVKRLQEDVRGGTARNTRRRGAKAVAVRLSVAAKLPPCRRFLHKLMLSLEIKICWASLAFARARTEKGKEKYLPFRREREVGRRHCLRLALLTLCIPYRGSWLFCRNNRELC